MKNAPKEPTALVVLQVAILVLQERTRLLLQLPVHPLVYPARLVPTRLQEQLRACRALLAPIQMYLVPLLVVPALQEPSPM